MENRKDPGKLSRQYKKSRRAEQEEETRLRILEAIVQLHEEIGPAATSVKAIAERAGVQRLTVYRHFPDEASQLQACTNHYLELNPPPRLPEAADGLSAEQQTETLLLALARYYQRTRAIQEHSYRDLDKVASLAAIMAQLEARQDAVAATLAKAWKQTGATRKQLEATIRHTLRFTTWQSLQQAGLNDKAKTALYMQWIRGVLAQ